MRVRLPVPALPTVVLLLVGASVVWPSHSEAQSWTGFRGPNGDGRAIIGAPDLGTPQELKVRWKVPLGSGYSGLSVESGVVVTAFASSGRDVLAAFSAADGSERWRFDLGPMYPGKDGAHDGPIATPVLADGRVFMVDPAGRVVGLDSAAGELLWEVDLVEDLAGQSPWFYGYCGSPLVHGRAVIVTVGGEAGSVVAFDVHSGDLLWRSVQGDVVGCATPVPIEMGGKQHLAILGNASLHVLDPTSGRIVHQAEHGGNGDFGSFTSSPLPLSATRLLIKHDRAKSRFVTFDGGAPSLGDEFRGLGLSYSPPTVSGDHVVGYTSRFFSAQSADGEQLWRSREPSDGFVISVGDRVVVLTKKGALHVGTTSAEGWAEEAKLDLFSDLAWTPPTFAEGSLFVRSLGEMARVDLVPVTAQLTEADLPYVPTPLVALRDDLRTADDADVLLDSFLDGKTLPIIDDDRVVFLWRGAASDVAIAGDMLGMRTESPMNRLADTDLWWWETTLDPRGRWRYAFFVDYRPTIDPHNPRQVASTVISPNLDFFEPVEGMAFSWFDMPKAAAAEGHWQESTAPNPGTLETFTVAMMSGPGPDGSPPRMVDVSVKVWLPPGYSDSDREYPVVFVHNPWALEVGGWQQSLDHLVGTSVEPLIAVFPEARDLTLIRTYREGFLSEILPRVEERYRVSPSREHRATVGMGIESLNGLLLGLGLPEQFGKIGLQSLWGFDFEKGMIETARAGRTADDVAYDIYFDWGEWDMHCVEESWDTRITARWLFDSLREHGWKVAGGAAPHSFDWLSWRERTDDLLGALFPLEVAEN